MNNGERTRFSYRVNTPEADSYRATRCRKPEPFQRPGRRRANPVRSGIIPGSIPYLTRLAEVTDGTELLKRSWNVRAGALRYQAPAEPVEAVEPFLDACHAGGV